MSQDRMQPESEAKKSAPQEKTYEVPDIDDALQRASKVADKVRVVHGVNEGYYDLEGKTVGYARKVLRDLHNIPGDADAMIGQDSVDDEHILEGGMSLEFIKDGGTKGRIPIWIRSRQWNVLSNSLSNSGAECYAV